MAKKKSFYSLRCLIRNKVNPDSSIITKVWDGGYAYSVRFETRIILLLYCLELHMVVGNNTIVDTLAVFWTHTSKSEFIVK